MARITAYRLQWNVDSNRGRMDFLVEDSDEKFDIDLDPADFTAVASMLATGQPASIRKNDQGQRIVSVASGRPAD